MRPVRAQVIPENRDVSVEEVGENRQGMGHGCLNSSWPEKIGLLFWKMGWPRPDESYKAERS
jgi:hypothetical protein